MTKKFFRSCFRPGPLLPAIGSIPNPGRMEGGVTTAVCNLCRLTAL